MKIPYIQKRFSRGSTQIIQKADEIITEYRKAGDSLTLRQLYYQFVARDILPNKQSEYKRLGSIINDARMAGMISWYAIEDRTRNLRDYYYSELGTPRDILSNAAHGHELDHWEDQKNYVEVWIEKDALVGVIEKVCNNWRVPYFACRGYNSQSEQWRAGKRIQEKAEEGKEVHILHLGDHDPSGLHMTVDNSERLSLFSESAVNLHRLALNMDQVKQYKPPPNPAKEKDSRFKNYFKNYGKQSWELDALEPKVIRSITEKEIKSLINNKVWAQTEARQNAEKEDLLEIARGL